MALVQEQLAGLVKELGKVTLLQEQMVGLVKELEEVKSNTHGNKQHPLSVSRWARLSDLKSLNITWENDMYKHCKLDFTFKELRDEHKERYKANLPLKFRTGALGPLMQHNLFEVWLCLEDHYCSHPDDTWFCWVIDESVARPRERAPDQYIAWGHNSDLQLF